jgi:hypothetical protein
MSSDLGVTGFNCVVIRHSLWSGAIPMKPVTMFVLFACLLFA